MSEYDDAVTVRRGTEPGRHHGRFSDDWVIGNAVNGGLVMAAALTALGHRLRHDTDEHTEHLDPVAISAYFLTAARPGPFTTASEVVRRGRTLSTGQVSVHQPGADGVVVERMRALASFGDLEGAELEREAAAPEMPPPERCLSAQDAPPSFLAQMRFLDRLDLRLDPATAGWAAGRPSGRGSIRGWLRMRDDSEPDPTMLVLALDALPPVAFDLGFQGWTPTLEFTGHVRRRPAPGWLQVALTSQNVGGGLMEEDATVWDATGRLVAQSRQLCGYRDRPPR
ncbi:thioesterase family protein [Terracoccus luteus]|uniref:Acyl-CoA thioesterase n=1 Tax=Terracoccus luteus TaxID=53356 RepID=A0A839PZW8_9MICO|nr:thioesterase family protein [Terracoccus luteus]MBB2985921.1 acyl-CoA thioesterase [Terracoccus luteus]MCP2171573.1 acyl-CoA thioesterase [Terracoccus luteus]